MKARIKHFFEVIAGALLPLLGFSACERIPFFATEYGVPHANYKLEGTVKNSDGEPIEGIEVEYRHRADMPSADGNQNNNWFSKTYYTDSKGKVSANFESHVEIPTDMRVTMNDADGDINGMYEYLSLNNDQLDVTFKKAKNSAWLYGTYTISFEAVLKSVTLTPAEYGTPHAYYKVIGSVKDEDGNPIPGIQVLAKLWEDVLGSTKTDAAGEFTIHNTEWPGAKSANVTFEDIDGPDNGGEFQSTEADVAFTQTQNGDGHWNEGSFEGSVDITLKKK